jgi:SAM-dependent methyltransferase
MVERLAEDRVAFWGEAMAGEEPLREGRFPLVQFQTAIAWRVIEDYLGGSLRVLDAGAGTGRYALPIAARGHRVTHLDVSAAMLARARAQAERDGLRGIEFRQGDVRDLSALESRGYDLTLCLDAPLSYAWPQQARALAEVCRVTADVLVLMVSSRSGVLPFMIDFDMEEAFVPPGRAGTVDPFFLTESILHNGVEDFPPEFKPWLAQVGKLTPPDYAFTIPELSGLLHRAGFAVERLGGPGALARSIRPESLQRIRDDRALFQRFIDYSLAFDFDPHCAGMGAVNVMVVARRIGPTAATEAAASARKPAAVRAAASAAVPAARPKRRRTAAARQAAAPRKAARAGRKAGTGAGRSRKGGAAT